MNVVYVDKNDQVIGSGLVEEAVSNGVVVRISQVFLENSSGDLLIQKRSDDLKILPGKWDQSAGGHVNVGENYSQSAYRLLKEEMGIDTATLARLTRYYSEENEQGKIEKHFSTLFFGSYDGPVNIDKREVSEFRWVAPEELEKEMSDHPANFTGGCVTAYREYIKYKASLELVNKLSRT